jgi:carboxylate-amine ligase
LFLTERDLLTESYAPMTRPPLDPRPTTNERQLTLGVEEEFHLVDLGTRRSTPRAGEVLAKLAGAAGTFAAEMQQTTVETNTEVVTTLDELRRALVGLRAELTKACEPLGMGVAAAGTMPLPVPITITENARFRRMLAEYQTLVREQLICGLQIHVGIGDPDTAAVLLDRLARWLPPLLALSASSPFSHDGKDTGYASTRALIWSRWPTTGSAGAFSSAAEYDAMVQDLIGSGVISDRGMIYFDVRPSAHAPTLELRICDACPLVDTAVLIAALFRAAVVRECALHRRAQPSRAPAAAVQRAAMWRAARSALEGELVDLDGPRPVPAGVLVRGMIDDLRPELEIDGSWPVVRELGEEALARGSSAARQREALRRRARIADVVDLLVAETAGRPPESFLGSRPPLIAGYDATEFDEALRPDGQPRASHAAVLETLLALSARALQERKVALDEARTSAGLVFRASGQAAPAPFAVDFVPRVLTGQDWGRLQGGTTQRARALDAFVNDVYGERAIVRDGVVPARLATDGPGYQPVGAALPAGRRRIQVAGFDVVRDGDGRWLVLEDNVRVPSGVAYAIACRRLLRGVFSELFDLADLHDPEQAPGLLRRALAESAPARSPATPALCLLSSGAGDSAYFEHVMLASAMEIPLVTGAELLVQDDVVWRIEGTARRRVDVIYLRIDGLTKTKGADGQPLGPALERAVRAATVTLANAPGNGVADDKALYAYVPKLIEYYLGERPLLEQVRTYHCADPDQRAEVLARLDQLVTKPVDGYGGMGVVIGPQATERELAELRARIDEQPARWIAQELVPLSTHPTFDAPKEKRVECPFSPRHVDLRVFVYYGASPVVAPAPLTRMAPAGSMVVNSSRGGGAKDTWLLR